MYPVSDKEIDEAKTERDLSVSPINSDQSESYEKAATLEGLNPEAISPEEDFTSLSEEEEKEPASEMITRCCVSSRSRGRGASLAGERVLEAAGRRAQDHPAQKEGAVTRDA